MNLTSDKRHYVANVPPALLQHPTVSPKAKLVAIVLLLHYNRESELCYPTEDLLAAELGMSERTVMRAIRELRDAGLIEVLSRAAPRGNAKGRANTYRLTALLDLCSRPVLRAAEVTKMVAVKAPSREVTKTTPREVTKTTPHSSENRAITVNSLRTVYTREAGDEGSVEDTVDDCYCPAPNGDTATIEAGEVTKTTPHSARTAMQAPLKGLSAARIHEHRLAPDGTSAFEVPAEADAWSEATAAVRAAGGEDFNPGDLTKLCEEYENGYERVWYHAKWFLRLLASLPKPPDRPTAYFVAAVRADRPAKPNWPDYCRYKHGQLTEDEQNDLPSSDAPAIDWERYRRRYGWRLTDLPAEVQERINNQMATDSAFAFEVALLTLEEIAA